MAPKPHRTSSGLARTHSRSSSHGSKMNLNLQLTQKEPAPLRHTDKHSKKGGHLYRETNARNTSPFPRNNSSVRIQSKEHIAPNNIRRVQTASAHATKPPAGAGGKQKVGFTISSPDGDDDEWVSSESGAATPSQSSDNEGDHVSVVSEDTNIPRVASHTNGFTTRDEMPTPRARTPPLPRVDTARPPNPPPSAPATQTHFESHPQITTQLSNSPEDHRQTQPPSPSPHAIIPKARSETHSPPRRSPDHILKRQSMTRPPSTHSVTSRTDSLRPHPLIRAHSYGQGLLTKPVPLAPLATADVAPALMSSASSPTSLRAVSPSTNPSSVSPVLSQGSFTTSEASKQLRRTSTSSVRSTATLPVGPSASQIQLSRSSHDRQRTMSSSSTFAALSTFAMRSTPSPPRTPIQQLTVTFPPPEPHLEGIHPLLPPPYLSAHLTVLAYRNPLSESYDRVFKAKQAL
ncbi:hypothetical protein ABKN59_002108 [Abortiporus biennis]